MQADGKIWVADSGNNAIKRMNADGSGVVTIASGFDQPAGIAIQADGKILIADSNNNAIKRMNADGTGLETLGLGFNFPFGVAVQADGKILVVDRGNNVIKRMDADGSNIVTLAVGFDNPVGVALQADGKIIVADAVNNVIKRMNADGTNIELLGTGFNLPTGVAVQADGKIVVVNYGSNTIKRIIEASTSNRVVVSVTVNPIPTAPTASTQTLNTGATVADLTPVPSATILWYDAATGGTALASDVVLTQSTYYVVQTANGCESDRTAVNVTLFSVPPTALSPQIYAGDATIANLTATGTNLQWYANATGGTVLETTMALSDGATYYVSQTINNIESQRIAVSVQKISESEQSLCDGATITDFTTTPSANATPAWFSTTNGSEALATSALLSTNTYYVEQSFADATETIGSDFNLPHGIALQADGKILFTDSGSNTIKRMNADGTGLETVGSGFSLPFAVAVQADGKIWVADSGNNAIKRMNADGSGVVTIASGFDQPAGIAIQADGKILIADSNNNAIKRINADGSNLVTLGSGFNNPFGVAVQADGKILVVDRGNNVIKRMDANGLNIVTLAEGFDNPVGVALQADGKIIVADAVNNAVKRMNADGTNIELLGTGFNLPTGVAVQANGKIVVADYGSNTIKRITEASTSNRVAVSVTVNPIPTAPTASPQTLNSAATVADLTPTPSADIIWYDVATGGTALATDVVLTQSTYYVVQTANGCESERTAVEVTLVTATPTALSPQIYAGDATIANLTATGTNLQWYANATGGTDLANATTLTNGATYYVSQTVGGIESIRIPVEAQKISEATQDFCGEATIADLASTPSSDATALWFNSASGSVPLAVNTQLSSNTYYVEQTILDATNTIGSGFNLPHGIAVQADGKILFADSNNHSIKRMNADGSNIETLGSGFLSPFGVAVQADGKILVADSGNNAIKRMNADGSVIMTLDDNLNEPAGIAVQADGQILIADAGSSTIKRMNADGSNIVTLGSGFNNPFGVAVQTDGKILVVDSGSNTIKRMNADGSGIVTLATGFFAPRGIAVQADGKIIIADAVNNVIKRMNADGTNIELLGIGFNLPTGVAVQADGKIVVADSGSNTIKKIIEASTSNSNRVAVSVIVNPIPAAPAASPQTLANGSTTADLTPVPSANILWFDVATGGTALATDVVLTAGTYYVAQKVDGCESERTAIEITLVTFSANSPQIYAGDTATIANLTATGINLQWYANATGGTALSNTTTLNDGATYYVSQTIGGIESIRIPVLVQKISEATQAVCDGDTLADLVSTPTAGATTTWFTSASGGEPLANATPLATNTYYVQQSVVESPTTVATGVAPWGIAVQADGKILIADAGTASIKRMNADGLDIETVGSGFNNPLGIAVQANGKILVADAFANAIKRMNADGSAVETFAVGFSFPIAVAVQSNGQILFTDGLINAIKRMDVNGSNIVTLATGFNNPFGVAVQADGKILVVDRGNNAIKRMNADGSGIVTLATGLDSPRGISVQADGKILVAVSNAIKRMNADGSGIETIGTGFNFPTGVAVQADGKIVVADYGNNAIKRIEVNTSNRVAVSVTVNSIPTAPTASAQTVNTGATIANLTPAPSATILWYNVATGGTALAPDVVLISGTYYVSQVNANGCISERTAVDVTFLAPPTALSPQIFVGDATIANLTATGSNLQWYATATGGTALENTTVLTDGAIYYVSQTINSVESTRIPVVAQKISEATQDFCGEATIADLVSTPSAIATAAWFSSATSGEPFASNATLTTNTYYVEQSILDATTTISSEFNLPQGIAVQSDGKILVAELGADVIKRMNPDGSGIETLGSGFNSPREIAVQADGKILVAELEADVIKRMNTDGSNIETLVVGSIGFNTTSIAVQADGKILYTRWLFGSSAIMRMDSDGSNIVTLATGFNQPYGIAVQVDGKILIADSGNNVIKRMNADGSGIVTLATGFFSPRGIAVQADGKILIADTGNNVIKRMNADGTGIEIIASGLGNPSDIAQQADGSIVVANYGNNAVKRITEASTSNRIAVSVTVTIPIAPTAAAQTLNTGATIADLTPAPSENILWYDAATGGTALATNTVLTAGTYYVAQVNGNGCESDRTAVEVTLVVAPTALSPQVYAGEEATIANLTATGSNLQWYETATGGAALENTTVLTDGAIYYVSQTINTFESTRIPVVVQKISEATQAFCGEATLADLESTPVAGANVAWFTSPTGGEALASNATLSTNTYYVEQSILESTTTVASGFGTPFGIAVQADGKILVADYFNHLLKRMNPDGSNIITIAEFTNYDVAVQADGKILTSQLSGMSRRDANGGNLVVLVPTGLGLGGYFGIALQSDGKILSTGGVFDGNIRRMNPDGSNIEILATGFDEPMGIAVQADGKILVTDWESNTVTRMDADGSNIEILGSGFFSPIGIVVLADGKILIADRYNNAVKRMNADGSNIETVGTGFENPAGIAVQADGKIVVTEISTGTVKRITLASTSNRVAVTVIVNPIPTAPTASAQTVNTGATVADLTPSPDATILWYDAATGGTALATNTVLTAGTYYVSQIANGCESDRTAVEVTLVAAPTALSPQIYAGEEATIANLTATGSNLQWYETATGGAALENTTVLTDGATYYVSQTINSVESIRIPVVVVQKISEATQAVCDGDTIADLTSTPILGATTSWFTNATAGEALPTNALLSTNTYYVEQSMVGSTITVATGFNQPHGIAVQADGKILIADAGSGAIRRIDADGTNVITLRTGFNGPLAVAVQADGKILVADSGNGAINRMNADGSNIETISSGLNNPTSIAVQEDGKILFAEAANNAIKRMDADGSNIEILGTGFNNPFGVAVQADGKILVVDRGNNAIKRMNPDGTNIVILATGFNSPVSVAVQVDGKIIVADAVNNAVKRMNADGSGIETIGTGFNLPTGVAVEASGTIVVANYGNNNLKRIEASTSNRVAVSVTVNPIPTAPTASAQTVNTGATVADLTPVPSATILWYDAATGGTALATNTVLTAGTYYVAQVNGNGCESDRTAVEVTLVVAPTAISPQIFAGNDATIANLTATGSNLQWYATSTGGAALENTTVLTDGATYYVSQTINSVESTRIPVVVQKISEATQVVCDGATIADLVSTPTVGTTATWFTSATGGEPLASNAPLTTNTYYVEQSIVDATTTISSEFSLPRGIAVQSDGKILVAEFGLDVIKRMNPDGSGIETLGSGFVLSNVAVQSDGKILIADSGNNAIKRMNTDGSNIETLVGLIGLNTTSITVQADGKILIVDAGSNTIKRLNADGSNIETIGSFIEPIAIAVQADGKILVGDTGSNSIKRMNPDGTNVVTLATGFVNPVSVAVQADGKILVADDSFGTVTRMNADGSNIEVIGTGFNSPRAVAVENGGSILLAHFYESSITRITEASTSNRVAVTVIVNPIPTAPTASAQTVNTGATVADLTPAPSVNILWYDAATGGTALATDVVLTEGTYYVSQVNANGCESERTAVEVTISTLAVSAGTQTNNTCFGGATGSATVLVSGGTPVYTYSWSPSGGTEATASNLSAVTYTVTVTDALGNTATQSFTITEPAALDLTGITINPDDVVKYTTNPLGIPVTYSLPEVQYDCTNALSLENFPPTPAGFTKMGIFGGHTYYISNTANDYASNVAAANGITDANLVTITSSDENNFLVTYLQNNTIANAMIGLNDIAIEGFFVWNNGEIGIYSNWANEQPSNSSGNEDAVEINSNGTWNDIPTTETRRVIIEIPYAIEQTSGLASGLNFPPGTTTNSFTVYDRLGNTTDFDFEITVVQADYIYFEDAWLDIKNPNGNALINETLLVVDNRAVLTSPIELGEVTIRENAVLEVTDVLKVDSLVENEGTIVFKSSATKTAQFDTFLGDFVGSGTVEVERYFPAKRAFRFFSSPVTTTSTIFENLQESGSNEAGLGTHITGNGGASNGFDTTLTNNPSAFIFNNAQESQSGGSAWSSIANTNTNTILAGQAIRLLVRGDRNTDLSSNTATPSPTILRTKGAMHVGDFNPIVSEFGGNFNFIGNPFQAAINVSALNFGGDINSNFIYVWDAQLAANGAYVTVDNSDGSNAAGSSANQFVQPGQGFFIRNNLTVTNVPSITIQEISKSVNQEQLATFNMDDIGRLNLKLWSTNGEEEQLVDATGMRFHESYNPAVDDADAGKLGNISENLAVVNGNKILSIDKRPYPATGTEIPLFTGNYKTTDYVFKIEFTNWMENVNIYLIDNYLDTITFINEANPYSFTVDSSVSASTTVLRFALLFEEITLNNDTITQSGFDIYPNPTEDFLFLKGINEEVNIKIFDVAGKKVQTMTNFNPEHSIDISKFSHGVYFIKIQNQTINYTRKIIKQ
uniref:virginiamycin B lyase family protein n=1 Tax=Flavobacterium sp. TaxID=239 RepID=UPI00404ABE10